MTTESLSPNIAVVATIPACDYCKELGEDKPAVADGSTVHGPWAFMCLDHFLRYGKGLGLGRGQMLKVAA